MGFLDIRASPRGILEDTLGTKSKAYIYKLAATHAHNIESENCPEPQQTCYCKQTNPYFSQLSPTFSTCQPRDPHLCLPLCSGVHSRYLSEMAVTSSAVTLLW